MLWEQIAELSVQKGGCWVAGAEIEGQHNVRVLGYEQRIPTYTDHILPFQDMS